MGKFIIEFKVHRTQSLGFIFGRLNFDCPIMIKNNQSRKYNNVIPGHGLMNLNLFPYFKLVLRKTLCFLNNVYVFR